MANVDPEMGAREDRRVILSKRQWKRIDAIAERERVAEEAKEPNRSRVLRRIVDLGLAAEEGGPR